MEEKSSQSHLKRPFLEDEDSDKPPMQKRVRFPKSKKVKKENIVVDTGRVNAGPSEQFDPRVAAKERADRRTRHIAELFNEEDNSKTEVNYEDDGTFVNDGIQIDPFNLNQEREEGYFDEDGNYVEYINNNQMKDAWLDSAEVDTKFAGRASSVNIENDTPDLSSQDIKMIKRRIANLLEPGETILQALRRLKGTTNNRKEKMSAEIQLMFDQLTEDASRLLENGDHDVYDEKREAFERDAGANNDESFDMFADDYDENTSSSANPSTHLAPTLDPVSQPSSSQTLNADGALQNDYAYDESSGYYYSSSLGYYYDPSTGLYCDAASGQWYSYSEETCKYDEVHSV